MNIKTKLYTGFGAVLALVILMLLLVLNMLSNLNGSMNDIVKDRYAKLKNVTAVRYEISNINRELYSLVLDNKQSALDTTVQDITASKTREEQAMQLLEKSVEIDDAKTYVAQLRTQSISFDRNLNRLIEMARAGQHEDAVALLQGNLQIDRIALFDTVEQLKAVQENRMETALQDATKTYNLAVKFTVGLILFSLIVGGFIAFGVVRSTTGSLRYVASVITRVTEGSKEDLPRIEVKTQDEVGEISKAFNAMAEALEDHARHEREFQAAIQEQSWLKTKFAEITTMYQGVQDLQSLAGLLMSKLAPLVSASYGVFYLREGVRDQQRLVKLAAYADNEQDLAAEGFRIGEGLVGQCAQENRAILLTDIPDGYIRITSGLGSATPTCILVLPVEYEGQVRAVIELASFEPFTDSQRTLLNQVVENVGTTINSIAYHMQVEKLLKESQAMTEELQSQSEELQLQQEELKTINEKLEEQYNNSETKTRELQKTKVDLEDKARQLVLSSKYKSEFLANMSHELRTPLNSLLILAQMLAENVDGNLSQKQIDFANTIHASGNDLLNLINDVLDLSKVESGKMDVHLEEILLEDVRRFAERQFEPLARQKGLAFTVNVHANVPGAVYTDEVRLQQIVKNLLSNAFKFTEAGGVHLDIRLAENRAFAEGTPLAQSPSVLAISVTDTGIGIPKSKQEVIFEAFRQADGTTSRKYGGTGLGLSISREIAQLLGGTLEVISVEGRGSTFTFYLPTEYQPTQGVTSAALFDANEEAEVAVTLADAETEISTPDNVTAAECPLEGKKVLLVDDDMRNIFALTTALEAQQMKVIFAENGREGVEMLRENLDVDLVLMDIMMPEMDGYEAMRLIRQIPGGEDLPIIALTAKAMKNDRAKCIDAGASDYISKPLNLEQLFSLMRVWLYR
ncbi:response regulator [Tumebacillus sp. ITR2]|uniref:histidine kinase n=1 Tax=Tumebacillus amylolyticus TaxID=2801339 RepID=A0ABS1JBE3_9BACL|nr:ATP-binding protein [Tumebacillus amylolyticus]MBL0387578.1 response regulator [Tumebacillus amylolyticus]